MFAIQTITEPVKATKTGARHSFAKWLLLPKKLRSNYNADDYDYEKVKAGYVEFKDSVLFIYRVRKKLFADTSGKEEENKKLGNQS